MKKFASKALALALALVMLIGIVPAVSLSFVANAAAEAQTTVVTGASGVRNYFKSDTYFDMPEKIDAPATYEFELVGLGGYGTERGGVIFGNYGKDKTPCISIEVHRFGKLQFYVNSGSVADIQFDNTKWDFRKNARQHVAVTVDVSARTATLYVNGEFIQSVYNEKLTKLPKAEDFLYPFRIGGDHRSGNTNFYNGSLYSVALYSDIRTAEEIKADAQQAKTWDPDTDGLIAAYDISRRGEFGCVDYSGNGRTLKYTNGSGLLVENFGSYNIEKTLEGNPETVEAWLFMPKYYSPNDRGGTFFGNNGGPASNSDIAFEIEYGGHPRFFYNSSTSGVSGVHEFGQVNMCTGTWQHLTIVHDAANGEARCYINGVLKETLAYTETKDNDNGGKQSPVYEYSSTLNTDYYVIGGDRQGGYLQYFKGFIKELRVYSDVRSDAEIAADYSGTLDTTDANLLLAYQMSQANAYGTIEDLSGNGYTATYNQLLWESHEPIEEYAYSFAVVGDTQTVTHYNSDKLKDIYQWIVDNKEEKNIQYVIGLGDITEKGEDWGHANNDTEAEKAVGDAQWQAARDAISLMDGNLPYTLIRGAGHDGVERFNEWFGEHEGYTQNISGYYKEDRIENVYHTFRVGNVDYMILCLDFGAKDDVLAWANEVVAAHPTHRVIVTTHAYMKKDGSLLSAGDSGRPSSSGYDVNNNDGDDIWNKFVRKHPNICMVMCGHMNADDVIVSKQIGDFGNEVTQMMINPQGMDSSASPKGMVAMLYFSADGEDVQVEYYSTLTDQWRPNQRITVPYGATAEPSYENLSEKYVVAKNTENGRYTVIENKYFQFLGGSLRYTDASATSANIRFGYQFSASVDLSATRWSWNYGVAGTGLPSYVAGSNFGTGNTTNLVITGVPTAYFASDLESRLSFDIEIDGVLYTVIDRVRIRSVLGVAQSIVKDPYESSGAKNYAQTVINACAS